MQFLIFFCTSFDEDLNPFKVMITFDFYITLVVILVCRLNMEQECSDILLISIMEVCLHIRKPIVCALYVFCGEIRECFRERYPRPCSVFWLPLSAAPKGGGGTSMYSMTGRWEGDSRSGFK